MLFAVRGNASPTHIFGSNVINTNLQLYETISDEYNLMRKHKHKLDNTQHKISLVFLSFFVLSWRVRIELIGWCRPNEKSVSVICFAASELHICAV